MEEPPFVIDGARVLAFAILDAKVKPSERASMIVGGVALDLDAASRLVVAENLVDGGVFLLHCNRDWQTVAAGQYPDALSAQAAADAACSGMGPEWTRFRDLTPTEEKEVETTRAFLRELAADSPGES